ncbi:hypothetical protein N657DRAFT_694550 [Parathielavia appendiculata]|uniref:Uncharacterized protein n=1 Tax=Parathielavia appendiculata TaxID=2587402 RepID=A0AAN6TPH5_9PEZI|nr:hypothetical protein N657DRAFT_694550 [Parathielavia appendiculata]
MQRFAAHHSSQPRRQEPKFQRIWRQSGELRARRAAYTAATELTPWSGRDLDIIIAPLDGKFRGGENEYQRLIELYNLPNEFVWERERGVTHSFGHQLGEDGLETLWMHFLAEIPGSNTPDRQPEWLKWGFVLTWLPKVATSSAAVQDSAYTVSLIVFQPPVETMDHLVRLVRSSNWMDATVDPYVLVDIALVSWYHRIDKVAWQVTKLIRTDEEDVFRRVQLLRSKEFSVADLDLHRLHTSLKNAIFMLEGLDAAIRLVELALLEHESPRRRRGQVWENTHRLLRHRGELFQSTKLRTVSSQARVKNSIDLAFHINTAYDSRVNLDNSRSVRLISIVGMVFIPFSAITSIFGTQFFTPEAQHMNVNPDFWVLWVIAIPMTITILAVWQVSEHDSLKFWRPDLASPALARWWITSGSIGQRVTESVTLEDATELRDLRQPPQTV